MFVSGSGSGGSVGFCKFLFVGLIGLFAPRPTDPPVVNIKDPFLDAPGLLGLFGGALEGGGEEATVDEVLLSVTGKDLSFASGSSVREAMDLFNSLRSMIGDLMMRTNSRIGHT